VDVLLVVDMQEGLLRGTPKHDLIAVVDDRIVSKTLNDPFFSTSLQSDLAKLRGDRLLVAGWATDLCVDATIRSAAALGFKVVAVADCHTVSDRPHLSAGRIIDHHHWVWANLIAPHPVRIVREAEVEMIDVE